ncbi:MAG TPA: hypothetical protein VEL76_28480 [Gemmataceae bacterium]|nr:hypothetical protein [Gemmataceae bacterium]
MEQEDNATRKTRETLLTLMLTAVFGGGFLVFLILVTGGFFFYVIGAVATIGMIGSLHYCLWGQALSQEVADQREEEELRERLASRDDFTHDKIRTRRF